MFLQKSFIDFGNFDYERFSGRLKEKKVKDKMDCSFYFWTVVTSWVDIVLKIAFTIIMR